MPTVAPDAREHTPGEEWWAGNPDCDWYAAQVDWAADRLRNARGFRCLVIGSPWPEARRLADCGWHVTYLDVREVPERDERVRVTIGDATALLFGDGEFDAVSSTCVLCHAGLGRYGDPIKANGDALVLAEIHRVLRPGGHAAVMVGPAVPGLDNSVVYGNVHRIYSPAEAVAMCELAGFDVLEAALWDGEAWDDPADATPVVQDGHAFYGYLSVFLRKRATA